MRKGAKPFGLIALVRDREQSHGGGIRHETAGLGRGESRLPCPRFANYHPRVEASPRLSWLP